jgi:hypothetical protein
MISSTPIRFVIVVAITWIVVVVFGVERPRRHSIFGHGRHNRHLRRTRTERQNDNKSFIDKKRHFKTLFTKRRLLTKRRLINKTLYVDNNVVYHKTSVNQQTSFIDNNVVYQKMPLNQKNVVYRQTLWIEKSR